MNYFISGGCKNGKSFHAQRIAKEMAEKTGKPLYYLATMEPHDAEDDARIARHIADRDGWGFTTIERPTDICGIFEHRSFGEITASSEGAIAPDHSAFKHQPVFPDSSAVPGNSTLPSYSAGPNTSAAPGRAVSPDHSAFKHQSVSPDSSAVLGNSTPPGYSAGPNTSAIPGRSISPDPNGVFLLDSVTALLSNEMFRSDGSVDLEAPARVAAELTRFAEMTGSTVFVSDYIYSDAHLYDDLTESYRKGLAQCDRALAAACDKVLEVAYTNITEIK